MTAPKPEPLFDFATDLLRSQALLLSPPVRLFGVPKLPDPNLAAAIADEIVSEGHLHRNTQPNRKDP